MVVVISVHSLVTVMTEYTEFWGGSSSKHSLASPSSWTRSWTVALRLSRRRCTAELTVLPLDLDFHHSCDPEVLSPREPVWPTVQKQTLVSHRLLDLQCSRFCDDIEKTQTVPVHAYPWHVGGCVHVWAVSTFVLPLPSFLFFFKKKTTKIIQSSTKDGKWLTVISGWMISLKL